MSTMTEQQSAETYEGWPNRETWAVALWINNDQGMQEAVHEALRELTDATPDEAGDAIKDYIDGLFDFESFYGETMPTDSGLLAMRDDIGSLWRVDWDALGGAFLTDSAGGDD